ncbi:MAG TPA: prepilin-type N-terminal cleavage/methylation domain-containing protein [Kofleriaceae bacterium]|nr:prepilin-type N-terminal cleavage/methylation domain-containing protein [Kofleriaceae bacterium]
MTRPRGRRDRRGERGFTLIELMIGMVLTGLVISFIFIISGKMSSAYFGQTQVAEVQQTLRSARAAIAADVRQAGFFVSNGFRTAALGDTSAVLRPLQVVNNADGTGPDVLRVFYADPSAGSRVRAIDAARAIADVDSTASFAEGDVVVLVNSAITSAAESGGTGTVTYAACVVKVTSMDAGAPGRLHFEGVGGSGAPYNVADNAQCTEVADATTNEQPRPDTVVYRFVGRSYRIDPDRKELGVLQGSPSGELVDGDWTDLALGVTTLQVASRFFEDDDTADLDGDGDPEQDWYSAEGQESTDPTGERPAGAVLIEVRVTVEARSERGTRAVSSARSGAMIDEDQPDHNAIGDWPGVQLAGVDDADRPEGYRGNHIYRSAEALVDLRNLGVGE